MLKRWSIKDLSRFSVSCQIVYRWGMTNCYFMSNMALLDDKGKFLPGLQKLQLLCWQLCINLTMCWVVSLHTDFIMAQNSQWCWSTSIPLHTHTHKLVICVIRWCDWVVIIPASYLGWPGARLWFYSFAVHMTRWYHKIAHYHVLLHLSHSANWTVLHFNASAHKTMINK